MKVRIHKNNQDGFTLIEVMVVVVIIAILAMIVIPRIASRPEQARLVKAHSDILAIDNAMGLYKLDNGFYPTTEQGIAALVQKPTTEPIPQNWLSGGYLKSMPIDPWGRKYHYSNDGSQENIKIWTKDTNFKPAKIINNFAAD